MAVTIEKSEIADENKNKPYELTEKQKRYLPVKRAIDIAVAGCASIVLSPVMGILALAIKLDSPGPVLFKQKRVGKDKELFEIWKFRTMRTDTPKDMPTHMLENPDSYITRTGRFMRKYSLDELPQFWQVLRSDLTIVGPRPALWNQDDLVAERDKYGANSVKPGITGWAQINGRDELEIPVKARFDGEYVEKFGLGMDIKCFFGTIGSVLCHDGVVEGGTGEMHKEGEKTGDGSEILVSSEKIDKEVRVGATVFGVAAVAGLGTLGIITKHLLGKKNDKGANQRQHYGIKILGGVAIGAMTGVALYKKRKDAVNKKKWNSEVRADNSVSESDDTHKAVKILFLANHFITLFSFRKELIQRLCNEGNEVYLSLPKDSDNKAFEEMGCKIIETDIDRRGVNPKNDFKLLLQYKRIMTDIKPDIVFSYTIKPNIYGSMVSNRYGYKQVCNVTGTGATFLKTSAVSMVASTLYKLSVKSCYKVFFQNEGDRDYFVKHHMIADNWAMLPGSGCNMEEHPYVELPDDEEVRFIFIGRVMELKGIDEFLACAKKIREKYSYTRFIIAGWNEEEKYKQIVNDYQKSGCVEYIGFRKDINEWIAKCHCTILPSHGGEGVPNVLLESAATGRACIASSINGSKDVIEDGITGYLFETGNSENLTEKVEEFLALSYNKKQAMGIAGREKVEREFNRETVLNAYMAEIKNIE